MTPKLKLALILLAFVAFALLACRGDPYGTGPVRTTTPVPSFVPPSTPVPNATHVIKDPQPIKSRIVR